MSTTKHTPGPWIAERCDSGMEILDTNRESVAVACHYGDPYSSIREEANARLIAAAPELLEALKAIMLAPNSEAAKARAFDAIAKATDNTL